MDNLVNKLYRMEHTYKANIEEVGKSLSKIGVNIVDANGDYRCFLEVLTDVKEQWDKLLDYNNRHFDSENFFDRESEIAVMKISIAQSVVGVRDGITLLGILESN